MTIHSLTNFHLPKVNLSDWKLRDLPIVGKLTHEDQDENSAFSNITAGVGQATPLLVKLILIDFVYHRFIRAPIQENGREYGIGMAAAFTGAAVIALLPHPLAKIGGGLLCAGGLFLMGRTIKNSWGESEDLIDSAFRL